MAAQWSRSVTLYTVHYEQAWVIGPMPAVLLFDPAWPFKQLDFSSWPSLVCRFFSSAWLGFWKTRVFFKRAIPLVFTFYWILGFIAFIEVDISLVQVFSMASSQRKPRWVFWVLPVCLNPVTYLPAHYTLCLTCFPAEIPSLSHFADLHQLAFHYCFLKSRIPDLTVIKQTSVLWNWSDDRWCIYFNIVRCFDPFWLKEWYLDCKKIPQWCAQKIGRLNRNRKLTYIVLTERMVQAYDLSVVGLLIHLDTRRRWRTY